MRAAENVRVIGASSAEPVEAGHEFDAVPEERPFSGVPGRERGSAFAEPPNPLEALNVGMFVGAGRPPVSAFFRRGV